jgi:PKD repeat protein
MLLLAMLVPSASAAVTSLEVTPESPVQGDVLSIKMVASPNESVPVTITFTKVLTVSGGRYELSMSGVNVPQKPNNFIVRAEGVQNLTVAAGMWGIMITKTGTASGGVATVSQGNIPPSPPYYDIKIYGWAQSGATYVTLKITASTTVTTDSEGRYTFNYDTSAIPPGSFVANVGGLTKSGTLSAPGGGGAGGLNKAPMISAVVPSAALLGVEVSFDASGSKDTDGRIVSWEWVFGDGGRASGERVRHVYDAAGTYQVTLTVKDEVGASAVAGWTLKVERPPNRPPVADAGCDRRVFRGGVVDFDGSGSMDPDGVVVSYSWDFGDGSSAAGAWVRHNYSTAGVFDVVLRVVDADGAAASAGLRVTVETPPIEPSTIVERSLGAGRHVVNATGDELPVTVRMNATGPVTLSLFEYPSNPHPVAPLPLDGAPVFYDISVSNPDAVDWPIYVEVAYGGGSGESSIGLYYFDGEAWVLCSTTGFDGVRGVVWAWLTRFEAAGSPLTIGAATSVSSVRVSELKVYPGVVVSGGGVGVSVTLHNLGAMLSFCPVVVRVGGVVEVVENVTLSAGAVEVVSFELMRVTPGVYYVDVAGLLGSFTVLQEPSPANIVLESFTVSPTSLSPGGRVEVSAKFRNDGGVAGERVVELNVNGLKAVSQIVSLSAGGETTLAASFTLDVPGVNTISLAGESREVTVVSSEPTMKDVPIEDWLIPGAIVIAAIAVMGVIILRKKSIS